MSSDEVKQAVGASPDADDEQREQELKAILAAPSEKERAAAELEQLEARRSQKREARGTAAATRRLINIARAKGSLVAQHDGDVAAVETAAATWDAAATRINQRARAIEALDAEANALVSRFPDAAVPDVPSSPPVPNIDAVVIEAAALVRSVTFVDREVPRPSIETDETRTRQRRDFKEVEGTPGYRIIVEAGIVWPPLTEMQKRAIEQKQRDEAKWQADLAGSSEAQNEAVAIRAAVALKEWDQQQRVERRAAKADAAEREDEAQSRQIADEVAFRQTVALAEKTAGKKAK